MSREGRVFGLVILDAENLRMFSGMPDDSHWKSVLVKPALRPLTYSRSWI